MNLQKQGVGSCDVTVTSPMTVATCMHAGASRHTRRLGMTCVRHALGPVTAIPPNRGDGVSPRPVSAKGPTTDSLARLLQLHGNGRIPGADASYGCSSGGRCSAAMMRGRIQYLRSDACSIRKVQCPGRCCAICPHSRRLCSASGSALMAAEGQPEQE